MVYAAGKVDSVEAGWKLLKDTITNGTALNKLKELVTAQGGLEDAVDNIELLSKAAYIEPILSPVTGVIQSIVTDDIGSATMILGGGRETKESIIDLSVGLVIHKKVGDTVEVGQEIATIYANDKSKLQAAKKMFIDAYDISNKKCQSRKFIKGIVTKDGIIRY